MIDFRTRSGEKEIMDLRALDARETTDTYRLIGYVNRFLGGSRVLIHHLDKFSAAWPKDRDITILDVGAGAADIPQAIIRWARRTGRRIKITALDYSQSTVDFVRERLREAYPEIRLIRASVYSMPFVEGAYDYVTSSMFFHHLKDEEIVSVLRIFDRIARRGIIINDLLRSRQAYYGISLLAGFTANPVFRNDAPLSVLRGFRPAEAAALAEKAGVSYLKVYPHFAYRFALAGEKHGL